MLLHFPPPATRGALQSRPGSERGAHSISSGDETTALPLGPAEGTHRPDSRRNAASPTPQPGSHCHPASSGSGSRLFPRRGSTAASPLRGRRSRARPAPKRCRVRRGPPLQDQVWTAPRRPTPPSRRRSPPIGWRAAAEPGLPAVGPSRPPLSGAGREVLAPGSRLEPPRSARLFCNPASRASPGIASLEVRAKRSTSHWRAAAATHVPT